MDLLEDPLGCRFILRGALLRDSPKVMGARLGLGRHRVEIVEPNTSVPVPLGRPGSGIGSAGVKVYEDRRIETHDLPSIDAALETCPRVGRRWLDIDHLARDRYRPLSQVVLDARLLDVCHRADRVRMNESEMRQIEQIIEDKAVVALDV